MNLLILTQVVNSNDPVLGFFHGWIIELSQNYEHVSVICLYEGKHDLPKNVHVFSLGKESGVSRFKYVTKFFKTIWKLRNEYESVFVHMNQEYVLLGGWLWRLLNKKITLWRNHKIGSWRTILAGKIAHTVCYTSTASYTASFPNAVMMPVGIDENLFHTVQNIERKQNSFLYVGRISPIKNLDAMVDGFIALCHTYADTQSMFTLVGPADSTLDKNYKKNLEEKIIYAGLSDRITFLQAQAPSELAELYNRYMYCLNFTESGSFDKTIWESVFCGCIPIVYNTGFLDEIPQETRRAIEIKSLDVHHVAQVLHNSVQHDQRGIVEHLMSVGIRHSLKSLVEKLVNIL